MAKKSSSNEIIQLVDVVAYVSDGEITNLGGNYLTVGSLNTLIKKGPTATKGKVITRGGTTIVGQPSTVTNGIIGSCDWVTSGNKKLSLRSYFNNLEVLYEGSWITVGTDFGSRTPVQFSPWWDADEFIDTLLFVNGTDTVFEWSGAITKVASITPTTITKQGYLAGTTIGFNDNGASPDTITDSANGFLNAGFAVGDSIEIIGSTSNDSTYTIAAVTAGVIEVAEQDSLVTEAAGASITMGWEGRMTWAEERFFSQDTKVITINGIDYPYTTGENTGTLTVTVDPTGNVAFGDIAMQKIREYNPTALDGMRLNLISTVQNQVYYGSLFSRTVYMSKDDDFTDMSQNAPREAGDGAEFNLDSNPTAFVPTEEGIIWISGKPNDWYKITFIISADGQTEDFAVDKIKTSPGEAATGQGAVFTIKNGVAFMSFEGIIEELSQIQIVPRPTALPMSDEIKDDLARYDKTDAHGLYFERNLWISLPAEGLVLIRDMEHGFWQPPQTGFYSRLAVIEIDGVDRICGHSFVDNETYTLDFFNGRTGNRRDGYNANTPEVETGAPIQFIAAFGYENYGDRFWGKVCDRIGAILYMPQNTVVTDRLVYDYRGATGIEDYDIDGSDAGLRFQGTSSAQLGKNQLGYFPLGNAPDEDLPIGKIFVEHETNVQEFFESQRIFKSGALDDYWELLARGENVQKSDSEPTFIRR